MRLCARPGADRLVRGAKVKGLAIYGQFGGRSSRWRLQVSQVQIGGLASLIIFRCTSRIKPSHHGRSLRDTPVSSSALISLADAHYRAPGKLCYEGVISAAGATFSCVDQCVLTVTSSC